MTVREFRDIFPLDDAYALNAEETYLISVKANAVPLNAVTSLGKQLKELGIKYVIVVTHPDVDLPIKISQYKGGNDANNQDGI